MSKARTELEVMERIERMLSKQPLATARRVADWVYARYGTAEGESPWPSKQLYDPTVRVPLDEAAAADRFITQAAANLDEADEADEADDLLSKGVLGGHGGIFGPMVPDVDAAMTAMDAAAYIYGLIHMGQRDEAMVLLAAEDQRKDVLFGAGIDVYDATAAEAYAALEAKVKVTTRGGELAEDLEKLQDWVWQHVLMGGLHNLPNVARQYDFLDLERQCGRSFLTRFVLKYTWEALLGLLDGRSEYREGQALVATEDEETCLRAFHDSLRRHLGIDYNPPS